jgi:hypothetical protein
MPEEPTSDDVFLCLFYGLSGVALPFLLAIPRWWTLRRLVAELQEEVGCCLVREVLVVSPRQPRQFYNVATI